MRALSGISKTGWLVTAISLLWGSEWLLSDALAGIPRMRLFACRCALAACLLAPWALRRWGSPARAFLVRNMLLGLLLLAAPAWLGTLSRAISPGMATLLFAATPLVAALLENRGGIGGAPYLLSGLAGVAFLVRGALSFSAAQGLAILWTALSVLSIAFALVKAKSWLAEGSLAAALFVQMLTAAIASGSYSLIHDAGRPAGWVPSALFALVLLSAGGSVIAYLLFYRLLRSVDASQIGALQWIVPFAGVLESSALLRQLPSWDSLAGGLLALISAVLVFRRRPSASDEEAPLTLQITGEPRQSDPGIAKFHP